MKETQQERFRIGIDPEMFDTNMVPLLQYLDLKSKEHVCTTSKDEITTTIANLRSFWNLSHLLKLSASQR